MPLQKRRPPSGFNFHGGMYSIGYQALKTPEKVHTGARRNAAFLD
jgi:hypothetical protein